MDHQPQPRQSLSSTLRKLLPRFSLKTAGISTLILCLFLAAFREQLEFFLDVIFNVSASDRVYWLSVPFFHLSWLCGQPVGYPTMNMLFVPNEGASRADEKVCFLVLGCVLSAMCHVGGAWGVVKAGKVVWMLVGKG